MRTPTSFVFALLLFVLPLTAAENFGSAPPFRSGDVVCFVGDSITHGGTYHSIVTLYYATRFPDRTLTTFNCGIGGDRASGIMSDEKYRLNVDILARRPTAATIMLGMNDVGHGDYRGVTLTPEVEARRQASLAKYEENMQKLIVALQRAGAKLTLITPSIYDEATQLATASPTISVGGNAALGVFAEKVRGWAKQYGTGLVDFDHGMNEINTREQKTNPSFTVVGPDRVHPGPVGHFVMGHLFLKAQGLPRVVATIGVDAKQKKASGAVNCAITHVQAGPAGVSFTCAEKALPLVVPAEAQPALALVPFMRELNEEKLVVTGLATGDYELKIDDQVVGRYGAEALQTGVNLAANDRTPQYRQSAAATKISGQRTAVGMQLRGLVSQLYGLSKAKVDVSDAAAVEQALTARLAASAKDGKAPDARIKSALEIFQKRAQLEQDYLALATQLHEACQPKPHRFALTKL
jgi:lysophospholipase L1-like esterase